MKKEIFAGTLLVVLFGLSLLNARALENLTGELTTLVDRAEAAVEEGDWDGADYFAQRAAALWRDREDYILIVVKHSDADAVEDALYCYLEAVRCRRTGAHEVIAELVREHLKTLADMEDIRPSSVF